MSFDERTQYNDKHIFLRFSCVYGRISAEVVIFTLQSVSNTGSDTEVSRFKKVNLYKKYTNFREAQVSMIPYFIRLSERTGNDQESSSENIRSSNLTNSPNLQVSLKKIIYLLKSFQMLLKSSIYTHTELLLSQLKNSNTRKLEKNQK